MKLKTCMIGVNFSVKFSVMHRIDIFNKYGIAILWIEISLIDFPILLGKVCSVFEVVAQIIIYCFLFCISPVAASMDINKFLRTGIRKDLYHAGIKGIISQQQTQSDHALPHYHQLLHPATSRYDQEISR